MFFSDDMQQLIKLFQKHDVIFAVCGGFAVAHYGFVRMTMDFDLLILPEKGNTHRTMTALEEFGFGQAGFTCETLMTPGTVVTLGEQPNQIDLLTSMSSQPTADILERAEMSCIEGLQVKIVTYEDLLFAKREAGRGKDRVDIEELERIKRKGRDQ